MNEGALRKQTAKGYIALNYRFTEADAGRNEDADGDSSSAAGGRPLPLERNLQNGQRRMNSSTIGQVIVACSSRSQLQISTAQAAPLTTPMRRASKSIVEEEPCVLCVYTSTSYIWFCTGSTLR